MRAARFEYDIHSTVKRKVAYLPHPAHVAFCKDYLEGRVERVCVVDYLASE
mgnify:CR=1 FL=1